MGGVVLRIQSNGFLQVFDPFAGVAFQEFYESEFGENFDVVWIKLLLMLVILDEISTGLCIAGVGEEFESAGF